MDEVFPFCPHRLHTKLPIYYQNAPHRRCPPPLSALRISSNIPISLPQKPTKFPTITVMPPPEPSTSPESLIHDKLLFLDSLGLDLFAAAAAHPPLATAPISAVRAAVAFLRSNLGLSTADVRRVSGMCPAVLAADVSDLTAVVEFLTREAGVDERRLGLAVSRRPRLLVSSVAGRLRPTMYFLKTLGIDDVSRHTYLLSCSVEDKLMPRLEFLESVGFCRKDARLVARRFPAVFCYSIEENLRPKIEFLFDEMKRELKELRDFPQFFSFSLENRIRPRHFSAVEKGVRLPLRTLLKPSDEQFNALLETCSSSSPPVRRSPLWQQGLEGKWDEHCLVAVLV